MKKAKKKKRKKDKLRLKLKNSSSKMRQRLETSGNKVVVNPQNEANMSEILLKFVDPLLEFCEDNDAFDHMIQLSITTWNLCFLPEDEQETAKEKLINELVKQGPEVSGIARQIIEMLMERKKTEFHDNKRLIVDYEIVNSPSGLRINVASTL